jgi:carbonic anhydrase
LRVPYRLRDPLEQNRPCAESVQASKPGFVTGPLAHQAPQCLRTGCADSRVPTNESLALLPGDVVVHRRVANVVVHGDPKALSVMQSATDQLQALHARFAARAKAPPSTASTATAAFVQPDIEPH